MHDELREKIHGNAGGEERVEIVPTAQRMAENAENDDREQAEEEKNADKTPLLGIRGKDEVGLVFRKKLELRLRPVSDPLPCKLAASDGDGRLVRVVSCSLNVGEGMQERQNARFLIVLQAPVPRNARKDHGADEERGEMLPRDAREKDHAEPDRGDDDRGSEIGLEKHESKKSEGVCARDENVADVGYLDVPPGEIFREQDNEDDLRGVRRLHEERAEVEALLRAFHDRPECEYESEEKDGGAVESDHERRAPQELVFGEARGEKNADCGADPDDLPLKKGVFRREGTHRH
ncbi:hypothetical protein A3C21_01665 [Candidatus Kaiserbacteria bacterium RIFCSPHIGHO2_02_FULL_59_21]|uniref:Uncharacterized protein n=1 Tax=Candidatus Kaiserbacteria bacterium RIFCSPHIGHO2_02_FULL_59_21 TaxID=1798500 RepID=A0A1F6DZK8_9BACT|nr:MAG: hypothetical protein A3C21_01665 [Candidatus Kaiserbacteria bacterium RIFCSPHIGHO2_02_FULL_59_21]